MEPVHGCLKAEKVGNINKMAKACPKCKRQNADSAKKCIYCGNMFPELAETKPEIIEHSSLKVAKKSQPTEILERFLVIVSPIKDEPTERMLKTLAKLMNWDLYLARQRLKTPVPWILRTFEQSDRAEGFIRELNEAGLDAYLLKETGLEKLESKLVAKRGEFIEQGIRFQLANQGKEELKFSDLFLIVVGRIRIEGALKKLFSLDVESLQSEGDSALYQFFRNRIGKRKREETRVSDRVYMKSETLLMDLYKRSSHNAIRIIESEFEFGNLFPKLVNSNMLAFSELLKKLRTLSQTAYFDDNYKKIAYSYAQKPPSLTGLLGVLSRRSQKRGLGKTLYDSNAQFNHYSSLVYLHYLRQDKLERKS